MALWHCHSLKKPLFPSNLKSYFIWNQLICATVEKKLSTGFVLVLLVLFICRLIFLWLYKCEPVWLCSQHWGIFGNHDGRYLTSSVSSSCGSAVISLWLISYFSGCCLRQRHCSNIVINGVSPAISQSSQMSSLHSPSMCCIIYLNRQLLCGQGIKFAAIVCDLLYSDILIQMVRSNTCSIRVVKIWGGLNYNVILI